MAKASKWSGVAVSMQSAIGVGIPATAITNASPGVLTHAGTSPANGSYVLLSAQGMAQVDNRVFRVSASTATTFALEGEDTTLFDTFTSGTFQLLTMGTSITTATTISNSGGDFNFIDTTTIHQNARTQIPGSANAASYEMEHLWDVSDAGLAALKIAADLQAQRAFKFTFGTGGQIMVFNGYVGATLLPGGTAQQLVTTKVAITMSGSATYYSA